MKLKSIAIILLIIAAAGFLFQQKSIQEPVLNFLNSNIPWSIPLFTFVKDNLSSGTLIGLFLFLVFANIPLLPSPPAEAYAIFAFSKGTNIFGILFLTVLVYMLFAVIYYFIGRFYGQKILEKLLRREIGHIKLLDRFIGPLVFFAYLLPLPLPIPVTTILVLVGGFYKTDFRKVMAAVAMGTLLRFILIMTLYHFYTPVIEPYLSPLKLFKVG